MSDPGTMIYAEVIGDPIDHSRSPMIHHFWLSKIGMEADYRATRVTRADLPAFVASRRADDRWRGSNVTMPLKLDALLLADVQTDHASTAKAANLLAPREDKLVAANTDVGAVMKLVAPLLGQAPPGVTVLGNGGAARAVLVALRTLGYGAVRLQARDLASARSLAVEFGLPEPPSPFDRPIDTGGLVNATPLGMTGHPPFHLDLVNMPAGGWVLDLVTDPIVTPLIAEAREAGLVALDGLQMLVEQAAASFEIFFDAPAPREHDRELAEMLRS